MRIDKDGIVFLAQRKGDQMLLRSDPFGRARRIPASLWDTEILPWLQGPLSTPPKRIEWDGDKLIYLSYFSQKKVISLEKRQHFIGDDGKEHETLPEQFAVFYIPFA